MAIAHDKDWLFNHEYDTNGNSVDSSSFARAYYEHMAPPLLTRIAELEAALEAEHRESYATDLPYEPHPLLAKEPS